MIKSKHYNKQSFRSHRKIYLTRKKCNNTKFKFISKNCHSVALKNFNSWLDKNDNTKPMTLEDLNKLKTYTVGPGILSSLISHTEDNAHFGKYDVIPKYEIGSITKILGMTITETIKIPKNTNPAYRQPNSNSNSVELPGIKT